MNIPKVVVAEMGPSKNKNPQIMFDQFHYRKTGEFIGENAIVIADMLEPIWWNRPQVEDTDRLIKQEADGIFSYNLPIFLGKVNKWKSNYNVILNKNNVPISMHLKFDHKLTENEISILRNAVYSTLYNLLLEIGIPKTSIAFLNNDLLINGKKISGSEQIIRDDNIYEEDTFITLGYNEEKEIFDRLTGFGNMLKKPITGLFDEFDVGITKAEFIELFRIRLDEYYEENFK